ncbi:hypothetical protein BV898_11812 [Hypsibius exemplaris]|uniref:Uncharacterized protein n=1 Tax=Hypsibius exemplaris TaxID=2072580 RepID=A0A1W0WFD8_HYPEX|nr:hypothetical protein BV898_11812 [Hypsibius exemplaris]
MIHDFPVPKLNVGSAWVDRPQRTLSFLTGESLLPVTHNSNLRHFILLAKYRPLITFVKEPNDWDLAARRANERFEQRVKVLPESNTFQPVSNGDLQAIKTAASFNEPATEKLKLESISPRPGSTGWPHLHTAQRYLTRQRPRCKVSNEELYASLRKPPAVDILGPKWRDHHKKSQTLLLHKASTRSLLCPLEKGRLPSSRISSARSMTNSVVSSTLYRSSLHSGPPSRHRKSSHMVTYTPLEEPLVKDSLAPDWREQHKKRQEKLLRHKEIRQRRENVVLSARSVAAAALPQTAIPEAPVKSYSASSSVDEAGGGFPVQSQGSLAKAVECGKSTRPEDSSKTGGFGFGFSYSGPVQPKPRPVSVKPSEQSEQYIQAQMDVFKDWLRTQLPSQLMGERADFHQLKAQVDALTHQSSQLKSQLESHQRKCHVDIECHFSTFARSLRDDISTMLNDERSFWVPESAKVFQASGLNGISFPATGLVPPKVLKVRTILPFNQTSASQRDTARCQSGLRSSRSRSTSIRSLRATSPKSPTLEFGQMIPALPEKNLSKKRDQASWLRQQNGTDLPFSEPCPSINKSTNLRAAQTQHNLALNYPHLPAIGPTISIRSAVSEGVVSSAVRSRSRRPSKDKTNAGTQFPEPFQQTEGQYPKLVASLVSALVNKDRRLAKSRQTNLLLRGIIEQSTIRIGLSAETLKNWNFDLHDNFKQIREMPRRLNKKSTT